MWQVHTFFEEEMCVEMVGNCGGNGGTDAGELLKQGGEKNIKLKPNLGAPAACVAGARTLRKSQFKLNPGAPAAWRMGSLSDKGVHLCFRPPKKTQHI